MPVNMNRISFNSTGLEALTDVGTAAKGITLMERRFELDKTYGLRGFRVVKSASGDPTTGQWLSQELATTSATACASAGTTTTIVTTGLTANAYSPVYGPCWAVINDDAGAAGAAPEGECSNIISNTTTVITLGTALSAATAASDTYSVIRLGVAEDSAEGDGYGEVLGVCYAASVTSATAPYLWAQFYGFHKAVVVPSTTAIAAGVAGMIASTSAVDTAVGSTAFGKVVGMFLGNARAADAVRDFWPFFITVP